MSMNQDDTREWTVLVRITEHSGLGDHPWWTPGQLSNVIREKLTAIEVDEVVSRQAYLDQDLDDLLTGGTQ